MFKKLTLIFIVALFLFMQTGMANAGLVQNGDFTTGDFSHWTLSGDPSWAYVISDSAARTPGGSYAIIGSPVSLSQAIATVSGQSYTVSFWLANDWPGTNQFQALWNGTSMISLIDADAFGWTLHRYKATAAGDSSTIGFSFLNEPSVFKLTDVNAAPVPIPGALLLFGPGLAGLAVLRKKFC